MITTKLTDAEIYNTNPFSELLIDELQIKRKTQMIKSNDKNTSVMLVNSDGENVGHSAFVRQIEVDEDKFAKLYISQLGALWDLHKTSMRVISYILSVLKPNEDKVYFDVNECVKHCEWSGTKSVYTGLVGLLNAKIIARTDKNYIYYINPRIIFNGSRVTLVTTYIKKSKTKIDKNQKSLVDNIDFLKDTPGQKD